ncbi:unnamed protein product, partial [Symbiodinium sp. KB8]
MTLTVTVIENPSGLLLICTLCSALFCCPGLRICDPGAGFPDPMTDESTQLLPRPDDEVGDVLEVPLLARPEGVGPLGDEPMEGTGKGSGGKNKVGNGETELDSSQRLGLVPADVRGRGQNPSTLILTNQAGEEVDELQIVIGGWNECRREDIESEVRNIFHAMNADALVKQVRAILSTQELCIKHVGPAIVDKARQGECLMLMDARGNETGLEAPPDIFFLQELGDVRGVAEGASRQDTSFVAGAELRFIKREDLRISLPSDHNAIQELMEQEAWDNDCINQAFREPQDPWLKFALMQEIRQLRIDAKVAHKENLLQEARQGNYRAIAHMRASAAGGQTEGSYVHRAGGRAQAAEMLFSFYADKYSAPADLIPSPHQVRCLEERHSGQQAVAVTTEEILLALHKCKSGVSAGMDGANYEGLKYIMTQDKQGRMAKYFTELIRHPDDIPEMWRSGKIVLLPKVARPAEPKDLRPICLTPVLCRLFAKVLMKRVHRTAPEHSGHQIGCRQGVQTMDGVLASQSAMQLLKQSRGAAYVAKIDIKAAFDSLSRTSVLKWLSDCSPSAECLALYRLLDHTRVQLSMAGESRTIQLQRGLMQGTSYSADVFSRVMDYFLAPLHDQFNEEDPTWNSPDLGLPHFIIYADDVILFADSPQTSNAYYGFKKLMDSGRVWLTRIWSYLGHLDRISPLDVKPSWVADLLIRRVQRIYDHWDWASEWPSWELMAKDRTQWNSHARTWVRHWTMSDTEGVATFEYLYDRQLILLKGKKTLLDCLFRPAKDFTDTPYTTPLCVIKPAKSGGPVLWTKAVNNTQQGAQQLSDAVAQCLRLEIRRVASACCDMSPESMATDLLQHGEPGYPEVHQVAQALLQDHEGPVTFGAYVRVKVGIRNQTYQYPETIKLFTAFLADEFAGDAFLTIQIQRDVERAHRRITGTPVILRCVQMGLRVWGMFSQDIAIASVLADFGTPLSPALRATLTCLGFVEPPNVEGPPPSLTLWRGSAEVLFVGDGDSAMNVVGYNVMTGQKLQMLFMTLSEVWYSMSWSDVPAGVQYTMYGLGLLTVIFMARKFIQKTAGMVHGILQVMHGILQATGMVHGIRQASDPRGIQSSTGIQDIMTMLEKMQQVLDGHSQGLESLTQSVSLLSGVPSGDGLWEKLSEKFDAILVSFQEPNQKITRRFQVVDAACEKLQELLHQTTDMLGKMMKTVDALSTQSSMEIVAQAIEKTTAQLEKVGPQLDQCLQNIAAASNAEKGRFTMLDGAIKNKIDQVHGEVVAKLGSVETTHSKLQGFLPQLQSAIGKLDSLPDKLDRTESLFRERDKACRSHTKAVEGMQQSIAAVQSALGQPPVDSQGVTAVRELVTNTDNTVQEMTTMLQELAVALTELKDKIPERPPYRQPPAQAAPPSQETMPMQTQQQGPMGGVAVTFPSGRTMYAAEDEILGYPVQGGTRFFKQANGQEAGKTAVFVCPPGRMELVLSQCGNAGFHRDTIPDEGYEPRVQLPFPRRAQMKHDAFMSQPSLTGKAPAAVLSQSERSTTPS